MNSQRLDFGGFSQGTFWLWSQKEGQLTIRAPNDAAQNPKACIELRLPVDRFTGQEATGVSASVKNTLTLDTVPAWPAPCVYTSSNDSVSRIDIRNIDGRH